LNKKSIFVRSASDVLSFCYCGIFDATPVRVLLNLGNGVFVVFFEQQTSHVCMYKW